MSFIHAVRSGSMALLASLTLAGVAGAQAAPAPRSITFDDAMRIALARNGDLRIARNSASLDAAAVTQQRLQFLPDLRVSTSTGQSFGRSFNQNEGRIVDQTTQSASAGLSSSLTLFDGFRNVASLKGARLTEQAGERSLDRAEQTVVFTVASNFVALVKQQEQLRVQRENLAALQAQERQIRAFVDAGSRPISDLYQQQAAVASAQVAVVNAERALELAKVDVMQTLQLDPRGTYEFVPPALDASVASVGEPPSMDSLLVRALAQRADLDARETLVAAAGQDVRAAKGSRWPTVSLSAGYNTAFSSAAELGFVDQLDQRRGGSVSIGISIPIFDRGSTDLAAQRARIAEDNARIELENQRQQIGLEVRRAYLDHQSARQQLEAAEAQQRAATLALQSTQQRYDVGAATLLEVTQARATQVQAASAVVSARYDLLLQDTLMDYYVGDLDPRGVSLG